MKIKPLKSGLKLHNSELMPEDGDTDLRTLSSSAVIQKLEANIKLRETPVDKRKLIQQ